MDYEFYFDHFEQLDNMTVLEDEISTFWDDEDLDDVLYEAKVKTDDGVYRVRISEDTSPFPDEVSNYGLEIAERKPRGNSHYWWRLDDEEFLKRSKNIFPKTLDSYIEEEMGIEVDEKQRNI